MELVKSWVKTKIGKSPIKTKLSYTQRNLRKSPIHYSAMETGPHSWDRTRAAGLSLWLMTSFLIMNTNKDFRQKRERVDGAAEDETAGDLNPPESQWEISSHSAEESGTQTHLVEVSENSVHLTSFLILCIAKNNLQWLWSRCVWTSLSFEFVRLLGNSCSNL